MVKAVKGSVAGRTVRKDLLTESVHRPKDGKQLFIGPWIMLTCSGSRAIHAPGRDYASTQRGTPMHPQVWGRSSPAAS